MKTIGLDLSLTATGFSVVDESGRLLVTGTVGYDLKKASEVERIQRNAEIAAKVVALAREYTDQWGRPRIGIEGYAFNRPFGREALAELHGVVRHLLWVELGVVAPRIAPNSARSLMGLDIERKSVRKKSGGKWVVEKRKVKPVKEQVRDQLAARGILFPPVDKDGGDKMDAYVVAQARRLQPEKPQDPDKKPRKRAA